jgi:hypothetical protein
MVGGLGVQPPKRYLLTLFWLDDIKDLASSQNNATINYISVIYGAAI